MAGKKTKKATRYMVQLDTEVARKYQKLSEATQIPIVRLVNATLKGVEPLVQQVIVNK